MASSSSSSKTGLGASVKVSQNEFNQFHDMDRILFTRLVTALGREPGEATQVMAYLIWLEKMSKDFRLVSKLLKWPDALLSDLVNEAVLALICIESDQFPYDANIIDDLPLTHSVTQRSVTLRYLHENRISIIRAVTKIINGVCIRAFRGIVQRVQNEKAMREHNLINNPTVQHIVYHNSADVVPQQNSVAWGGNGGFECRNESQNNEVSEMLKRSEVSIGERKDVPPDERTIFLTFSKGYPISEAEVRDHFSRIYGDIIEAVYMQEVQLLEQPLYARLVVHSIAMNLIDVVLEGRGKVKFSINGKHVWARKYVRKSTKSPPTSPSNSSPSPATSS